MSLKTKLTELPNTPPELPTLYIYCDLTDFRPSKKIEYMDRIKHEFGKKLTNHFIIVGDVDLKFAYISPQEAVYRELKQDHRSKE